MQSVEVIVNVPVVSHTTAGIETIHIGKFLVTKSELSLIRKVHYILVKYQEKGENVPKYNHSTTHMR